MKKKHREEQQDTIAKEKMVEAIGDPGIADDERLEDAAEQRQQEAEEASTRHPRP